MKIAVSLILLFVLTSVSSINAKTYKHIWAINKDHSEILFKTNYLTVSEVTGRFTSFFGRINFDEDLLLSNKITINIKSNSIYTGNNLRDGHLKSNDFLKSKKYPLITFKSKNILAMGPGQFKAIGELKIKNIEKNIHVIFQLFNDVKDTWGYESKFARFQFKIDRKDFGIIWNKSLPDNKYLVGDIINISGRFQIQPLQLKTPSFKYMIPDTKFIRLREQFVRGEIDRGEFNQNLKSLSKSKPPIVTTNSKLDDKKSNNKIIPIKSTIESKKETRTNTWWLSYFLLGFIGFLASIIICFYGKTYLESLFPKKYKEIGLFGSLADFFIFLPIIFAYSWSLWYIGFGG